MFVRPETIPICGFESAYYGNGQSIVFTVDNFVKYTVVENDRATMRNRHLGKITATFVTNDRSIMLVATEDEGNAKVIGLNTETFEEIFALSVRERVTNVAASSGSEVVACLSSSGDRIGISTFSLPNGNSENFGTLIPEDPCDKWEMSFCPADEGVICVLNESTAYLLRSSGGKIENFSSIKLNNVLCHNWSNDVTMCFGTTQGDLLLYRETISLETIDLRAIGNKIMENSKFNDIVMISSSSDWFGVVLIQGLNLIFENTPSGPNWNSCKAVVTNTYELNCPPVLSFDSSGEFFLYTNGTLLLEATIKYSGAVTSAAGFGTAARHSAAVTQVGVTETCIISSDNNGGIVVTSRKTGRHLVEDQIDDLLHFTMSASETGTFLSKTAIETRLLTVDGLVMMNYFEQKPISLCCSSPTHIAIFQGPLLVVIKNSDGTVVVEEKVKLKKDVRKMVFSNDSKYLIVLTNKDEVFSLDISTGKIIWSMDYKLKNFADVAVANGTVYLLDTKFIIIKVKHGKELGTLNMHAADIAFNCSTTFLAANHKMLVCSDDSGQIVALEFINVDKPYILKESSRSAVSYLNFCSSLLTIGYCNGSVVVIELERKMQEKGHDQMDFTLCDHQTFTNLKTVIRGMDYERNSIREEAEVILEEYKEEHDKEISEMRKTYETEIQSLRKTAKSLEESFQQSEADRKKTVFQLQEIYKTEEASTQLKFDKAMNEQIKKIMQLEEEQRQSEILHQKELEKVRADMRNTFSLTEQTLLDERSKLEEDILSMEITIGELKKSVALTENNQEKAANIFKQRMEIACSRRKDETKMLEDEIWNLKANVEMLTEEKDVQLNATLKEQATLSTARYQIQLLNKTAESLQKTIDQMKIKICEVERREFEEKKKFNKTQQQLIAKEKEFCRVEQKAQKATRRCAAVEAQIQMVSECVYNARKLEHAVLGLIAFMQNIDIDEKFKPV